MGNAAALKMGNESVNQKTSVMTRISTWRNKNRTALGETKTAWQYIQSDLNGELVIQVDGSKENEKLILGKKIDNQADQLWKIDSDGKNGKLVSKLGYVATIKDASTSEGAEVIVAKENGGLDQQWSYDPKEKAIVSQLNNMVLECFEGGRIAGTKIVTSRRFFEGISYQEWTLIKERGKPATSCHINYETEGLTPADVEDNWTIVNTCCVKESAPSTFFMVTGFYPGGYAGIQQEGNNVRKAIFSWFDHGHEVLEERRGPGVQISKFGGEGTGLHALKDLQWKEGEPVTFKVTAERNEAMWKCSCNFRIGDSPWELMAIFHQRGGENPLIVSGFSSFIENFDSKIEDEGYTYLRCAEYGGTKIITNGEEKLIVKAQFTKNDSNKGIKYDQAYASNRVVAGVKGPGEARLKEFAHGCFLLCTGGFKYQTENSSYLIINDY